MTHFQFLLIPCMVTSLNRIPNNYLNPPPKHASPFFFPFRSLSFLHFLNPFLNHTATNPPSFYKLLCPVRLTVTIPSAPTHKENGTSKDHLPDTHIPGRFLSKSFIPTARISGPCKATPTYLLGPRPVRTHTHTHNLASSALHDHPFITKPPQPRPSDIFRECFPPAGAPPDTLGCLS